MTKSIYTIALLFVCTITFAQQDIFIETESFLDKGGWLVDPQFVEQVGSPYLMAHGMGEPVANARTTVEMSESGRYNVWARTKDWVPGNWEPPGKFHIAVNGRELPNTLGLTPEWGWELAGPIELSAGELSLELIDLTGFNGRCDAIYLSTTDTPPPAAGEDLAAFRIEKLSESQAPAQSQRYDLVVTGGGLAGCASAIAAAEQGLKVALIHDRPLLGGNASSEIRVHTLGIYGHYDRILKMIDTEHYPNGSSDAIFDQQKRDANVKRYENIDLHLNWRAYDAVAIDDTIRYVDARQTATGERKRFEAPLFVDATGDGWIGYWAGAEFTYGRESVYKYGEAWDKWGELWSPEVADNFVMGSSILWQTEIADIPFSFPSLPWAKDVAGDHEAVAGEWYWEFSRNDLHQIHDGEEIRDHMLRAIFGSFSNAKKDTANTYYRLQWVSYLLGKRESRRFVGDHIFTLNDVVDDVMFRDSVVAEIREIDVHYQQNLVDASKPDFLSKALFFETDRYHIPYRSLYSRNIPNLFMAGRCFSTSHVGLGGPRVMRTTGQMGAAVGLAASLCHKYNVTPREVYQDHMDEYWDLIIIQKGLKN